MKKEENKNHRSEMNEGGNKKNISAKENSKSDDKNLPGYPHYPASEDIYNNEKKVDLNPDDLTKKKNEKELPGTPNVKNFLDETGEDLDVPGTNADGARGNKAIPDEENDYYSIGGDRHNDLEEDKG